MQRPDNHGRQASRTWANMLGNMWPMLAGVIAFGGWWAVAGSGAHPIAAKTSNVAATAPIKAPCTGPLTGRSLTVPKSITAFGKLQRLAALPLQRGEYVLTFDDGPNPTTTPLLLKTLSDHCVHGTFMLLGKRAEARPDLVRAILAAGNTIGSHSYDHADFATLSQAAIVQNLTHGRQAVDLASKDQADHPRFLRLPGSAGFPGTPNPAMLAYLAQNKLVLAGYDATARDWMNDSTTAAYDRLIYSMGDRGVLLMHDSPVITPPLLDRLLRELEFQHAKIVTIVAPDS